jgi:CheY-like chemotaxis protein
MPRCWARTGALTPEHAVKSGEVDFLASLAKHQPDAIIWDIAPPYDRDWLFYKMIRALRPLDGAAIVLTTTHLRHLNELAGETVDAIEIVSKPYDLSAIVDAVERAAEMRRRSGPRAVGADRRSR